MTNGGPAGYQRWKRRAFCAFFCPRHAPRMRERPKARGDRWPPCAKDGQPRGPAATGPRGPWRREKPGKAVAGRRRRTEPAATKTAYAPARQQQTSGQGHAGPQRRRIDDGVPRSPSRIAGGPSNEPKPARMWGRQHWAGPASAPAGQRTVGGPWDDAKVRPVPPVPRRPPYGVGRSPDSRRRVNRFRMFAQNPAFAKPWLEML